MKRRTLLATLPALLLTIHAARSQEPASAARKYAVLSLIGDKLSVVTYESSTGSSFDKNRHDAIASSGAAFDRAALAAADDALKKIDPKTAVVLLAASSPSLFADQEQWFAGSKFVVPAELGATLSGQKPTHLLLFTKYRGDAKLRSDASALGSGKLEGLGFYVDRVHALRRADTHELGRGFLAPFVYMKVSLIDLATLAVLRDMVVTASTTLSASRNKEGSDPWDVWNESQKVTWLRQAIARETRRVVPLLVSGS